MAQATRCSARAPLIALSGVTLAAAAASATLLIEAAASALGSLSGTGRSLLGVITRSGVTHAAAAASASLSIQAAALALRSLSGTGRSRLGACTADRPVGCDARCRSCVGYALDQAARRVSLQRPTCDCSARMSSLRLMRVCGLRLPYCSSPCCSRSQRQHALR